MAAIQDRQLGLEGERRWRIEEQKSKTTRFGATTGAVSYGSDEKQISYAFAARPLDPGIGVKGPLD
jgi:hypothetical protein